MRQATLLGVGVLLVSAAIGCSDDAGPGSEIGQTKGGSAGSGGQAGSLSLGLPGSGAGSGGASGAGGAAGSSTAGTATAGSPAGGVASHAGSSSGGSGTGGSKPAGMCKRAAGSDADCADFYPFDPEFPDDPARPQAYACDDTGAYLTLNGAHAGKCANVSFVAGAKYGACCPP